MVYLAFIFALALACLAGMEFISLMALETRNRQLKRRVNELERENARLSESLRDTQILMEPEREEEIEEAWPELIDDDSVR
jgi:ABC-type bacteriocin/lantibiotic exporter with double-glycine peptidase domain